MCGGLKVACRIAVSKATGRPLVRTPGTKRNAKQQKTRRHKQDLREVLALFFLLRDRAWRDADAFYGSEISVGDRGSRYGYGDLLGDHRIGRWCQHLTARTLFFGPSRLQREPGEPGTHHDQRQCIA